MQSTETVENVKTEPLLTMQELREIVSFSGRGWVTSCAGVEVGHFRQLDKGYPMLPARKDFWELATRLLQIELAYKGYRIANYICHAYRDKQIEQMKKAGWKLAVPNTEGNEGYEIVQLYLIREPVKGAPLVPRAPTPEGMRMYLAWSH